MTTPDGLARMLLINAALKAWVQAVRVGDRDAIKTARESLQQLRDT